MKHEDVTIVMQGPLISTDGTAEGLRYFDNYLGLVDKIIISTWDNHRNTNSFVGLSNMMDIVSGKDPANKLITSIRRIIGDRNIDLVTDDITNYNNYYNNANVAYQSATSLNGLKKVDTKYVIKLRCDEYYTDLSGFIDLMKSAPEKLTTSNFLFNSDIREQFHPSDHVIGGYTHNILGMFQTALDFCKRLPTGTDPVHCSQLGVEGYRNLYNNGLLSPESFLCICFLITQGIEIDCSQSVKIMKEHVQLVRLREIGEFLCKMGGLSFRSYEAIMSNHSSNFSVESMEQL